MTTEELFSIYDPRKADTISAEDIRNMANLTDAEIATLAKKYPNQDGPYSYLMLMDKSLKKQIFQRSTWQNLHNLRMHGGLKNFVAFNYVSRFTGSEIREAKVTTSEPQDLTKIERETAPGLKRSEPQIVQAFQDANKALREAENEPIIAELIQSATRDEIEPVEPIGDEDFEELKKEAEEKANKEKVKSKK